MDRYIGKKLDGRYEIKEIIGVGGMANVYKAYDSIDDRIVAVKILRDEHMQNDELLRRFRNESKAIAVLSHPNIVKVYDVSFNEDIQYIVMEHVDGITLKEYIEQQKVLRWKEAVHFTVQILRALQHAHDKGIVHRDIKPQNIMLLEDGTIKVADFGIARFARASQHTVTDKAIGSVHYISPEQAKGELSDEKSDIYSIGVMLYEMTTGTLPFDADSPVSVALKQIQSQAKRPRVINPDIPEGLEDITIRAMQKDPARRYQSAAEMLRDIDEFKRDPSISFEYKYSEPATENISKEVANTKKKTKKIKDEQVRNAPVVPVLTGITIAFIVVAIVFVIGIMAMVRPFEEVPDTTAPNLIGMNINDAMKKYKGFDIVIESSAFHEQYDKDIIYDQSVNPEMVVKEGATIKVKISSGIQYFSLADYRNFEENQVYKILTDNEIEFNTVTEYNDEIPEGYVIRTEPGADTQVDTGTVVVVYVSMGAENTYTTVPSVVGYKLEHARMILSAAGIRIGSVERVPDGGQSTEVLSQSLPEGTMVAHGSTISLVIVEEKEDNAQAIELIIPLPNVSEEVTMTVALGGETVITEEIVPSELDGYWEITVRGEGLGTITIYYDGRLYRAYTVDFSEQTTTMVTDYSENFGG
ncbi:MAG: Stk1 family PASTA domain-containing Ser/Thr kinase [Oscillospiraceae bacterium]|nr:Stk1 family PASTA domain-containing Ser/Thr kinase [Oscillospiraceae bacterium]MBQ3500244.1 Stk1 family PASTA domain-containing Ser/Thr kinase [Oscillospiraceae bacterium]MBQ4642795.1 Stk1 family PASTA domain-containing Ser/Thr kinase [Oscillospiraceae bacterium]